jgi:flavin reductase (DIM6/NTAB) family NADH-FMN oxidoreductase RutF
MLPAAVFVLGIKTTDEIVGCTISSVISLDVNKNQKILFTLGKNSKFGSLLDDSKVISVNLLSSNQMQEAIHFSKVSANVVSGQNFDWNSENDSIYLKGCESFLTCRLNRKIITESNVILILDVIDIKVPDSMKPLIYMNRKFNPTF